MSCSQLLSAEPSLQSLLGWTGYYWEACSLQLERKPLVPKLLNMSNAEAILRRPFKSPHPTAPDCSQVTSLFNMRF